MTERLFQFIWQFQYFNLRGLETVSGEPVQVIFPGRYNTNQGPDFTDARVKVGNTNWAGTVELHIRASDWKRHGHEGDNHYLNVILHVVWENDAPASDIPVVELKDRVSNMLLQRYEGLLAVSGFIPCERSVRDIPDITWSSWLERLAIERLGRKSQIILQYLASTNQHWEEVFWWLIARNFGAVLNSDCFETMARSLPLSLLAKHRQQVHQLEALLFGQVGLLEQEYTEQYPRLLQQEYAFLKHKYGLSPIHQQLNFLRMRPGNFPTVRLAQLAMLIHSSTHLFSRCRDAASLDELRNWLMVTANDYWHNHYRLGETAGFKQKKLGQSMIDNILINTIIPALFAFGFHHGRVEYQDKALEWLAAIEGESNKIIHQFQDIGIQSSNACETQALLELKNEYCDQRRCLDCSIGNHLLRQGGSKTTIP